MKINLETFNSSNELSSPEDFNACLNAHGLYQTRQFVLRLSPRYHELMKGLFGKNIVKRSDIDDQSLQAFSTYLHETVHWWQHKGTTSGFIRSALYLSVSNINMGHLIELTSLTGPKKPLLNWWTSKQKKGEAIPSRLAFLANVIVNNYMDTEFFLGMTYDPQKLHQIAKHDYFRSAPHSFHMAYDHVLQDLRHNIDPNGKILPDFSSWETKFQLLHTQKKNGHYPGSPIGIAPLGVLHIFEGQARFIQLQFLSFANGGLSIKWAREEGFLNNVYGKAFELFLNLTKTNEPINIDDPVIALFLLVCDLSLNPTEGFPDQIEDFENFHKNNDPGYRFLIFCKVINKIAPELLNYIKNYSRDEYITASEILTTACGYKSPTEAFEKISNWENNEQKVAELMNEHSTFKFGPPNIPSRLLLSEFISIAKDKVKNPEFFCWAGAWLNGRNAHKISDLWLSHLPLFSDNGNDETIVPRMIKGRENDNINMTFNNFYGNIMNYDLMRQWILSSNNFDLEFKWLTQQNSTEEIKSMAKDSFLRQFSVNIDDFEIIDNIE